VFIGKSTLETEVQIQLLLKSQEAPFIWNNLFVTKCANSLDDAA